MNIDTIVRLLKNSGFNVLGHDSAYVYIEDPSCITRSFETFVNYAWIILCALTAFLMTGWAISMIRGIKNDIATNIRNLAIIFATLSMAGPIINVIWGGDLFGRGCKTIKTPIQDINKILDTRKLQMSQQSDDLYEEFDIYDSGVIYESSISEQDTDDEDIQPAAAVPTPATQTPSDSNSKTVVVSPTSIPVTPTNTGRTQPTQSNTRPTQATAQSKDVIYTYADGSRVKRTGGSRAWRNNNPGNIRYSQFAQNNGAIGQAGGFAVFPDEDTGMRAIKGLLSSKSYNSLTVADAIRRYAPPTENDTAAYHQQIQKLTGLDINKRVSELTDAELDNMARAIRQIEGWTVGRIMKI